VLDHHHRHLDEAAQIAAASLTDEPAANDNTLDAASAQDTGLPVTKAEQRSLDAQRRRDARFEEAVRLREQGMTIRGIARALGVGRKTVRRWLRAGHAPTWRHADRGRSSLDPFRDYLEMRWAAGCRNGTTLLELSPPIAQAVDLAKAFSTMIKQSLADQLDGWIAAAENGGFKGFAGSLRQDRDAVHAALTLPWSTGGADQPTSFHTNSVDLIEGCSRDNKIPQTL
jgi:DNA-binding transcriptional regulator YiaG